MTRMIPPTIHSSVRSAAERRMFRVIGEAAPRDDWVCLHSLGLARHDNKRRGEIDFLLITSEGIFVLEVKGGRVRRENGVWDFTDRYGRTNKKVEGPFEQAASAMFALERDLRNRFGRDIDESLFGYGVMFPDIEFNAIGCEDEALVYDRRDQNVGFDGYVRRLTEFSRSRTLTTTKRLHKETRRDLIEYLRGDFDLVPSFRAVHDLAAEELIELTREQFMVLDLIEKQPRVIVEGPAGTGKTVLALEVSRRAARDGQRVLLLCFNRFLATTLRAIVGKESLGDRLQVKTVHGFLREGIRGSSIFEEFERESAEADDDLMWRVLYPEYGLAAVLEKNVPEFDQVVIDEGQDILSTRFMRAIFGSVAGGMASGIWRLFLDGNNQASIFGQMDRVALDALRAYAPTYMLSFNCRNTRPIALHTNIVAEPRVRAHGRAHGPPVEFLTYSDDDECSEKLRAVIESISLEDIPRGSVSILIPKQPHAELVSRMNALGIRKLGLDDVAILGSAKLHDLTWCSVAGFKGLENDVVIVYGLESVAEPWWRAIAYVGMSRARLKLFVVIHRDCEALCAARLEKEARRRLRASEGME